MLVQDVYDLLVLFELRSGVLLVFGTLAEHIHGSGAALPVEVPDHLDGFFELFAGDVAAGDFLHYRPRDNRYRAGYGFVYDAHRDLLRWGTFSPASLSSTATAFRVIVHGVEIRLHLLRRLRSEERENVDQDEGHDHTRQDLV